VTVKTLSEQLFEEFCGSHGIDVEPIETATHRTPDYQITVAGHAAIAEVKQLDPNSEDAAAAAALRTGVPQMRWLGTGTRVRAAIHGSRAQIRHLAKGKCAGLLVLYNNVPNSPPLTDPMMILAGMYGRPEFAVSSAPDGTPFVSGARFAGRRGVNEDHNTSLSAVCILFRSASGKVGLNFYHNFFAAKPFDTQWLRGDLVRHYGLRAGASHRFEDWAEL
jgi:hypothetical protein